MKKDLLFVLFLINSLFANAQVVLPYSQDFETATFPPTGWQTFPIGSGINWTRNTQVSGFGIGTACTSFDNFNTAAGSYYGIRLPNMNFTGVTHPYVRFQIAYAQRPSANSDLFTWYWSDDGSNNWLPLQGYSDATLTTASSTANLFVPSTGEWKIITLSLSSLAGKPFVRLAIEDGCSHGNMLYFDNVKVFDSVATGINEINVANQFHAYPDPFSSCINIATDNPQRFNKAELFNSMGSLLMTVQKNNSGFKMDDLSGLPEGIYFLRVYSTEGEVLNRKVLKL